MIAVLIPAYNEELTIGKVIDDFKKYLNGKDYQIYVYNNNSTDRTVQTAKEHGAVVRNEYKQGKGAVIRRMFREVEADCYLMVDGDDTYDVSQCMEMVNLVIEKHADMVIGDRLSGGYYTENKRRFHNTGNSLVKWGINKIFHTDISDIFTGYRAFSRDFVKTYPVLSKGFEVETEMTIHAVDKDMQIETMTVQYKDRPAGSVSKLRTIPDGLKVIKTIINMIRVYKPFFFFGIIGLILSVVSTLFFIPVVEEYMRTGIVLKFPTLIVCMSVYMFALQCVSSGIILQNLKKKERTDFEFKRTLIHKSTTQRLNNRAWLNDCRP